MSAFFLYSQAHRSQVKEENPDSSFGDIVSPSSVMASQCALVCVFGLVFVEGIGVFPMNEPARSVTVVLSRCLCAV